MAIHNDDEPPTEVSTAMNTFAQNSHFWTSETDIMTEKGYKMRSPSKLNVVSEETLEQKVKKLKKKKSKKTNQSSVLFADCEGNSTNMAIVCEEDLLQLRTVYKQCKSVMRKMELKYGNLLDSSSSDTDGPSKKRSRITEGVETDCRCALNKKIVFDEDGQEATIESLPSNHICPSKLMLKNQIVATDNQNKSIDIEYYNENTELSNSLQELLCILQDPTIEITYRNRVIEKIKLIKQANLNEVRFNKLALIEQLKKNPNEVLSFSGSNLSTITGYSVSVTIK